eukprot:2324683-Amphidinium_carterae.1
MCSHHGYPPSPEHHGIGNHLRFTRAAVAAAAADSACEASRVETKEVVPLPQPQKPRLPEQSSPKN